MVSFPDLSNISGTPNIGDIMSLPNATNPYFYAWILAGIWVIIVASLYFKEKEKVTKENILSSMSIACLSILILALAGSIVGFITVDIFVYILVVSFIIVAIWLITT